MTKYFSCIVLWFLAIPLFGQETIIVPSAGSITEALKKAQQSTQQDISIILSEGTYYLTTPLIINAADFRGKKLTITSREDEVAIVSGGKRIYPNWKKSKNNCWETPVDVSDFDQLFINGEKRILARYPNYTSGEILNGTAEDAISANRVKRWKNPEGGFIHAMHNGLWGGMHYVITGKKGNQLNYEGGFQNNRPSAMHPEYRFVENIREELDSPGEWFLDKEKQILYYYPFEGESMENMLVEVSTLPHLIEIRGEENEPARNITIRNLCFVHTTRTFMKEYEPLMRSDWCIYRGAAVYLENTQDCHIRNCTFMDLGGNAIFLSRYNFNNTITGNHIHHIGASAICLVGDTSAVRSGSLNYNEFVSYNRMDKTPGPKNILYPRQCLVEDNLIHHIGLVEKQVAGVQIQIASGIHVSHNTIYRVPRAAINVGDGAFGGHLIEYNDAFETVLETSDHGAFNSWGRDRFWQSDYRNMDQLTSEHPEVILLDAIYQTVMRNNRFHCEHGWDIDLDDGSSNYHIYNNVCLHGGIKLREGFYRTVENNIVLNNSFHPHVWFPESQDVVQRNIFMRPYFPIRLNGWGKFIDYNFFTSEWMLSEAHNYNTDNHSEYGDLYFKDPANGNYTLTQGSAAFNIGFENIPMDKFGVFSPCLKEKADNTPFPELVLVNLGEKNKIYTWLDTQVRVIDGLGDQSAYGLPDPSGVIILDIKDNSVLKLNGILEGDVIRAIEGESVMNMEQLITLLDKNRWKGKVRIDIIRNQNKVEILVNLQ